MCRRVGHDLKHCLEATKEQEAKKQYGEWMRAGWNSKGGQSKTWTTGSEAQTMVERETNDVGCRVPSDSFCMPKSVSLRGNKISNENPALENVPEASIATNQTALLLQGVEK